LVAIEKSFASEPTYAAWTIEATPNDAARNKAPTQIDLHDIVKSPLKKDF
jgi:hypothetical protein